MTNLEFIPEKKFMLVALSLADKSASLGEIPVGAVVVKDGKIIGRGYNTRERDNSPTGHAEIMAITEAAETLNDWHLSDCDLYVTLEPCPMCAGAAVNSRINRIIYGADDEVMGACGTTTDVLNLKRAHKPKLFRNFCEEESKEKIKSFFQKLRQDK